MILRFLWTIVVAVGAYFLVRKVHEDGFSNFALAMAFGFWVLVLLLITAVYVDEDHPDDRRERNIAGGILIVAALVILGLYAYGNNISVDLPFSIKRT